MLLYLLLSKMEKIYKEKSYHIAQFNSVINVVVNKFNYCLSMVMMEWKPTMLKIS